MKEKWHKMHFFAFFSQNILSYQKKAVPLHSLLKRKCAGCSSARLECLLWEQEVVSSNLAIPTNQQKITTNQGGYFFIFGSHHSLIAYLSCISTKRR